MIPDIRALGPETSIVQIKDSRTRTPMPNFISDWSAIGTSAMSAERERLSGELSALVLKRDGFIKEQSAKEPAKTDSFDSAVKETLKKQISAQ